MRWSSKPFRTSKASCSQPDGAVKPGSLRQNRMNERIESFLTELNHAWQRGDFAAVSDCYHPDAVMLPPDMETPIAGRDAVVATYRDFAESATLLEFTVTRVESFSFAAPEGGSALQMAHMYFDVRYEHLGTTYSESGLEIYALLEAAHKLQIVWRSQSVIGSHSG